MKRSLMALVAVVCCAMALFTSCDDEKEVGKKAPMNVVVDMDSVVLKPFMDFGASIADVEKYMLDYPGWIILNPDTLVAYTYTEGDTMYYREYFKDDNYMTFYFESRQGDRFKGMFYDYYFPVSFEYVKSEIERNGFKYEGELDWGDAYEDSVTYLFLSSDESVEATFSYYDRKGEISWQMSFQLTDPYDLDHVVK